ncbi:MAG: vWA domain-containing protein [Acidimicrobiales bacterium]
MSTAIPGDEAGGTARLGRRVRELPERLPVGFARLLRRAGLDVPADAALRYGEALAAVGLSRRGPVYWAGRATLVHQPEDVAIYDAMFTAFWLGRPAPGPVEPTAQVATIATIASVDPADGPDGPDGGTDRPDGPDDDGTADDGAPSSVVRLLYSPTEVLRHKDFAECTPDELAEAQRLMAEGRWSGARRRTRRRRPASGRGDWPDLRRTVRQALRTGGEPVRRRWLEPGDRPRRVVFLCDVSGSMAPYARALVRFMHAAVAGRRSMEAFTIGTRLTRVTRALSQRDPDAALAAAAGAIPDWSGGTRLGEALAEFNDHWGIRGLARGADVVVLSDGWDRGDPAVLGAEMARLARVAHRIVWVNPLKATPGYAPLVRGMAAALPHVDHFVEGHSLASLEALARVLGDFARTGRARGGGGRRRPRPGGGAAIDRLTRCS